ncbi:alpha/beta fold hydrolase [Brucella gallinifaecis]|uniref:Alpha/beta hydrolase n=1 Tax=Brucella gallinifaecis TaxID=215590 RepID=A0A502BU43_9HYPH|nr:alpha/beta hydrolase [Brucella gallinifaecis]TPF77171.1 alpha/beta hydrolase [Brucella gallinifaecis]
MPDFLFGTEANPIPAGTKAGLFKAKDNIDLRYAILKPQTTPSLGTIVLLQGRNEFIEKYFETMSNLSGRGFTVATMDWRGQGGSQRLLKDHMRGYVRRFSDYTDDLDQFFTEIVLPDCPPPYYILAHSAGALITYSSMHKLVSRVNRIVLCAPLIGLRSVQSENDKMRRMTTVLRWLGMGRKYATGGRINKERLFENNPLTSDPVRFARNMEVVRNNPRLALGGPTFSWIGNALSTAVRIHQPDFYEGPAMPVLIIAAGADMVVSTAATERFAAQTRNISLVVIDGARHELLQEADYYREQALAAFDAFIPGTYEMEALPDSLEPENPDQP